ncbi:MAG: cytochrome b [Pseudomonadota bacterium]
MGVRNTAEGWGWLARIIHWSVTLIILGLLGLGFYMTNFVEDVFEQFGLTQIHKSWGFTVFVLVLARMVWRLANPTPRLPDGMSPVEKGLAHGGHLALYVLMIAMPLSGWLMSSASPLQELYGIKNKVFGLFEMPDPFVPGSQELETLFADIHYVCAIALTAVVAAHAAAALKHHFIEKDNVLRRMIIGR